MTDSESASSVVPLRRTLRSRSPTKKIAQYDAKMDMTKDRRDTYQRKQTVSKKREAAAAGLAEAGQPRLSIVPEQLLSSPPPQIAEVSKGKGRLDDLPVAPVIAKRGRILSPEQDPARPGPRPKPSGDAILDGVNLEEWNRQRLIFYLSCRDGAAVNPNSDYSDLKCALGNDPAWHSDTDELNISVSRQAGNSASSAVHNRKDAEMGEFDDEPAPRKLVPVRAISPPQLPVAELRASKLPGDHMRSSQSATNLFPKKRPAEAEDELDHSNKRHQTAPKAKAFSPSASQPELASWGSGRARGTSQLSTTQPQLRDTGHSEGTSNMTRRIECPQPIAPARLTASKALPPAPDSYRQPLPTSGRLTGSRQGLGSRAPSEAPLNNRPLVPIRAASQAPARAPSMAPARAPPQAPSRAPSQAPVYRRASSQAPGYDRAPAQVPPRVPNIHARPQPIPQSHAVSRAPSPYGNPGRSCAPSQAPMRPRSRSPAHHARPRSAERASLGHHAPSQVRASSHEQRNGRQPQAGGTDEEGLRLSSLTSAERKLLNRVLEVSRANRTGHISTTSTTSRGRSSSRSGPSGHRKQSRRNSASRSRTRTIGRSEQNQPSDPDNEMDDADEFSDLERPNNTRGKRARLSDFTGTEREILVWAGCAYQVLMLVQGMYETDTDVLDNRRLEAWQLACAKYNKTIDQYPFKFAHMQNINDRLVTWRFHAMSHVRDKAAFEYFSKASTMTVTELEAYIKQLKAGGLHTKPGSVPGSGCFQHPLLQTCMNKMVFRIKRALGVQFPDFFREPTAELISFFCAILQFVVEEREIGEDNKGELEFEVQRKAYNTHLASHGVWLGLAGDRWKLIQKQLFLRGFKHSGASESALPVETKHVLREENLQPDVPDGAELAAWEEEMQELTSKKRTDPQGWEGLENEEPQDQDQPDDPDELAQPVHTNGLARPTSDDDDEGDRQWEHHARTGIRAQDTNPRAHPEDRSYGLDLNDREYQGQHLREDPNNHGNPVPRGANYQTFVHEDQEYDHAPDVSYNRGGQVVDVRHRDDIHQDLDYRQVRNDPRYPRQNDVFHDPEYTESAHHPGARANVVCKRDLQEYGHLNVVDDRVPDLHRDFGIQLTGGSDFGDDYDENGNPRTSPKPAPNNSFGDDLEY